MHKSIVRYICKLKNFSRKFKETKAEEEDYFISGMHDAYKLCTRFNSIAFFNIEKYYDIHII